MQEKRRKEAECFAERRIRRNRARRRKEVRKKLLLSVITFCAAVTLAFCLNGFLSNAKTSEETVSYKYYTSIQVESGQTLWTIAQAHMDEHYETPDDYIREVMRMNSLSDEKIIAGQHLIIPYYSDEFIE